MASFVLFKKEVIELFLMSIMELSICISLIGILQEDAIKTCLQFQILNLNFEPKVKITLS